MSKSFTETVKSVLTEDNVHQKENTNDTKNVKTLKPGSKHKESFGIDAKNKHGMTGKDHEDLGAPVVHPFDKNSYGRNAAKTVGKDKGRRADNKASGEPMRKLKEHIESLDLAEDATLQDVLEALNEDALEALTELEESEIQELFGEDSVEPITEWFTENVEIIAEEEDLDEEEVLDSVDSMLEEGLGEDEILEKLSEAYDLNEVSKETLKSYMGKAVSGKGSLTSNYKKRRKGLNLAGKKLLDKGFGTRKSVDEEEIDENELPVEIDMSEDIEALFTGEELSEEFKQKATDIFEGAVTSKLREYQSTLDEAFVEALDEAVEELTESLSDKVENYMNYVVEEWVKENEVALETSLRNELTEDFITGLRTLFIEHNIDIPESKVNVIDELTEQVEELTSRLDEVSIENINLRNTVNESRKFEVLQNHLTGLTDTQVEKLANLVEDVEYTNDDEFSEKVSTLKENYFPTNVKSPKVLREENVNDDNNNKNFTSDRMQRYVDVLSRHKS